jgi:hypothetical protein
MQSNQSDPVAAADPEGLQRRGAAAGPAVHLRVRQELRRLLLVGEVAKAGVLAVADGGQRGAQRLRLHAAP